MNVLTSILIYTLTILLTPIVLLFYSEWSKALLTFILNLMVITIPIAMAIGIVTVRSHRKPAST